MQANDFMFVLGEQEQIQVAVDVYLMAADGRCGAAAMWRKGRRRERQKPSQTGKRCR